MRRLLCLVLLLLAHAPASGQAPDRESELEAIRDAILGLKARLARTQRQQAGLEGELAATEVALELQDRRIAEARTARELAEEQLASAEAEVARLEEHLQGLQAALHLRLADLYRLGRQGYLRPLFAIRSRRDLLPGIRQLRILARRDRALLEGYRETRTRLALEREGLLKRREMVDAWLARETIRLEQLDRLQHRQQGLLVRLREEGEQLMARAATLSDKERKLSNLIDLLYGRAGGSLAGTPIQEFRGALDWPLEGRVVRGFGPRLDPRYGTRVPHNGIDLAVRRGAEVRAVFPGEVLFAAPFEGYGLTAVVHHPRRVFTLYAGLATLRVGQGDVLSLGQTVGASGDSLYFEIRVENRPEDPRAWLR